MAFIYDNILVFASIYIIHENVQSSLAQPGGSRIGAPPRQKRSSHLGRVEGLGERRKVEESNPGAEFPESYYSNIKSYGLLYTLKNLFEIYYRVPTKSRNTTQLIGLVVLTRVRLNHSKSRCYYNYRFIFDNRLTENLLGPVAGFAQNRIKFLSGVGVGAVSPYCSRYW